MQIIFIHGAGLCGGVFDLLREALRERAISSSAPDLPGHGARNAERGLASIAAMADDVEKSLPGKDFVLAGHSMGALVALALAARRSPSLRGLILMGAAAEMPVNPDLQRTAGEIPGEAQELILRWGVWRAQEGSDRIKQAIRTVASRTAGGVLASDLAACSGFHDGGKHARSVSVPSLVIVGRHDRMISPAAGEALSALMPGGDVIAMETGHMMMAEKPEQTAELMFGWLRARCADRSS